MGRRRDARKAGALPSRLFNDAACDSGEAKLKPRLPPSQPILVCLLRKDGSWAACFCPRSRAATAPPRSTEIPPSGKAWCTQRPCPVCLRRCVNSRPLNEWIWDPHVGWRWAWLAALLWLATAPRSASIHDAFTFLNPTFFSCQNLCSDRREIGGWWGKQQMLEFFKYWGTFIFFNGAIERLSIRLKKLNE